MDDPYLNDLRGEFNSYSNQLKKLKKKLLETNSIEEQEKIIKQIDSTAKKMENNQKQSVKVTKSRLKERKKKSKRYIIQNPGLLIIPLVVIFYTQIHYIQSSFLYS